MKNILITISFILVSLASTAQVPEKMSYQAVVRDASDELVTSSTIGVRISILQGSDTGSPVYVETQTPTTNENGLLTAIIGDGTVTSGDITTIDWGADTYYIKSEIDLTGGSTYTIDGVSQLLSVPYALHALNTSNSNSLDQAYDQKKVLIPFERVINVDDGSIIIDATGHKGLVIESDPNQPGLEVEGVGAAGAIDVKNELNLNAGDAINITNDGGGDAIDLNNDGLGDGIDILNDGDGHAINIDNNGVGAGVKIDNSNIGSPIDIDQSGNNASIYVLSSGNGDVIRTIHSGDLGNGIDLAINNNANTDAGIKLNYDGIGAAVDIDNSTLNPGKALNILNDGGSDGVSLTSAGGGNAMLINNDNAGHGVKLENDGTGNALDILNISTGDALKVINNSNGVGIRLENNSPNSDGLKVLQANVANASDAVFVENDGLGGAVIIQNDSPQGDGLEVWNSDLTNLNDAVFVENDGLGLAVRIQNDSPAGEGLTVLQSDIANPTSAVFIENDGSGNAVSIQNDSPLGSGIDVRSSDATNPNDVVYVENDGLGIAVRIQNDSPGGDGLDVWNTDATNANDAVYVHNDGLGLAVRIQNDSPGGEGLAVLQSDATNATSAVFIENDGLGDAMVVQNDSPAGSGIDVRNSDVTNPNNVVFIENDGLGKAAMIQNDSPAGEGMHIWNTDPLNIGDALYIDNDGNGHGVHIDNLSDDPGTGLLVEQGGVTTAVEVANTGLSYGMHVFNGNPDNLLDAAFIENGGLGRAMTITNGNPLNLSPVLVVENAALGKGIEIVNADPGNAESALFASHVGFGNVATFFTEDNDGNFESTLFANNSGSGSAATFVLDDNEFGKVNFEPAVSVISTGLGRGLNVHVLNSNFIGPDSNFDNALTSTHEGIGSAGLFHQSNNHNLSNTVDILNEGQGTALHVESMDNPLADVATALHVEQNGLSLFPFDGYAAHFDLQNSSTTSTACVMITSASEDLGSSALVVIPADPSKLAAQFEGKVEIADDLTVIGETTSGSASIGTLFVPTSAFIGDLTGTTADFTGFSAGTGVVSDLTVTTSFTAPAKSFKIDHPLDPANKFLIHNSIESNERLNIYSGNITTNEDGYAEITMPDYMGALNADFRYQLTIMDQTFAQAIIWQELDANTNTFIIKTNEPEIKVSWQITGSRIDTWALDNPLETEVDKVQAN